MRIICLLIFTFFLSAGAHSQNGFTWKNFVSSNHYNDIVVSDSVVHVTSSTVGYLRIDLKSGSSKFFHPNNSDFPIYNANKILLKGDTTVISTGFRPQKDVARYGGVVFMYDDTMEVFTQENSGLQASYTNNMYLDSKHRLWACHERGGVSYYKNGVWQDFALPTNPQNSTEVYSYDIQENDAGDLFFSTYNGIYKYVNNSQFILIADKNTDSIDFYGPNLLSINNQIWAESFSGIAVYENNKWNVKFPDKDVRQLTQGNGDTLYLYVNDDLKFLHNDSLHDYPDAPLGQFDTEVGHQAVDETGGVWVAKDKIYYYDGTWQSFNPQFSELQGLGTFELYCDRNGRIHHYGLGVDHTYQGNDNWNAKVIPYQLAKINSYPNEDMIHQKNGDFLYGMHVNPFSHYDLPGDGLLRYDGDTFTYVPIPDTLEIDKTPGVSALADADNFTWVSSTYLYQYDGKGFEKISGPGFLDKLKTTPSGELYGLKYDTIFKLYNDSLHPFLPNQFNTNYDRDFDIDASGNVWIIDQKHPLQLAKVAPDSSITFKTFSHPALSETHGIEIFCDQFNNVFVTFVSASRRGVLMYDGFNTHLIDPDNSKLPHPHVKFIQADSNGCHWFGTQRGLARRCCLPPSVAFNGDNILCEEEEVSITTNADHIQWQDGSTSSSFKPEGGGKTQVFVKNDNGCSNTSSNNFVAKTAPSIDLGKDQTLVCQQSAQLKATHSDDPILWKNGVSGSTLKVKKSGKYWATAENECGKATDTVDITLANLEDLEIPSSMTFAKLQDAQFDLSDEGKYVFKSLKVYNLEGREIFHTNDPSFTLTPSSLQLKNGVNILLIEVTKSCGDADLKQSKKITVYNVR